MFTIHEPLSYKTTRVETPVLGISGMVVDFLDGQFCFFGGRNPAGIIVNVDSSGWDVLVAPKIKITTSVGIHRTDMNDEFKPDGDLWVFKYSNKLTGGPFLAQNYYNKIGRIVSYDGKNLCCELDFSESPFYRHRRYTQEGYKYTFFSKNDMENFVKEKKLSESDLVSEFSSSFLSDSFMLRTKLYELNGELVMLSYKDYPVGFCESKKVDKVMLDCFVTYQKAKLSKKENKDA